jgi:predicted MPP superfamily phosphohydrolase
MSVFEAVLLGGRVAQWSFRCGLHGRFGVTRHEIRVPKEKGLQEPLVVAFASDLHAGPTTDPRMFELLDAAIAAQKPDLILLGGDYVSFHEQDVGTFTKVLARWQPRFGKYAVLGNHDLWTSDQYISERLVEAGARVLVNESARLPAPFDCVSICGIDDPWTGTADVARTFANTGPVRIFLTHSPDGLLLLKQERFDVGFAGHTHGGQVLLPGGVHILDAGGPLARKYSRGRFDVPGHGPLIVGLGVGCSNLPIRLNAHPELILCTLVPAEIPSAN